MKKKNKILRLKGVPKPLEEQIWFRLGLGMLAAIFGVILILSAGFYIGFPWLLLGAYMAGNGMMIARVCKTGRYTTITGICRQIETSAFRKRIKSVELLVDQIPMRIRIQPSAHISPQKGDLLVIYTSDCEPVYMKDGYDYLCGYYALVVADRVAEKRNTAKQ